MTWLCEKLGLPDPAIDEVPDVDGIEREAGRNLDHLLARWRTPLAGVEAGRFGETCKSRWNRDMTCESMLEHAVAHPLRHSFQLGELMEAQGGAEWAGGSSAAGGRGRAPTNLTLIPDLLTHP